MVSWFSSAYHLGPAGKILGKWGKHYDLTFLEWKSARDKYRGEVPLSMGLVLDLLVGSTDWEITSTAQQKRGIEGLVNLKLPFHVGLSSNLAELPVFLLQSLLPQLYQALKGTNNIHLIKFQGNHMTCIELQVTAWHCYRYLNINSDYTISFSYLGANGSGASLLVLLLLFSKPQTFTEP